jgi:hypothetical protein
MNENQLIAFGTMMLALSTFLGVLIAFVSFLYTILELNILQIFLYGIIYIDINLLLLYYIKIKWFKKE